jgi:NAD(P)-dependent dehydrogenase (short-subunit alcohol dehydrogenase family)
MALLENKVALVTGSSRSIGKAIAIAFAKEGADLVLAARNIEGLNATAKVIKDLGRKAAVVPTDVKVESQIENLFKVTMTLFGRLDILVNNSGIFNNGPIDKISTEDWDNVIATNLRAPFLCTRAAFAIMKKQGGGRIINIGSISASRVRQFNAPYSSAKFGLKGLTQTTALEGREFNITCGIFNPGNVERDNDPSRPPPGSPKEPRMKQEEVAAAVVFMVSQPPDVNVLEIIQLPKDQLYLGRG